MRIRVIVLGAVLAFGVLSACAPISDLDSEDPVRVGKAVTFILDSATKSTTFGATPDPVYYGEGCKEDQPTHLILYAYKPDTWVPAPASSPPIMGLSLIANYEFLNSGKTEGWPSPDALTFSTEEVSGGYRYAVLDLSGETFTGEEGWLGLHMSLDVLRGSLDMMKFGEIYHDTSSFSAGPVFIRARPCGKVPLDLIFTGLLPTPDPRFRGTLTVSPDSVRMPLCTPNTITVTYKPDAGPSLATAEPIEYWAVFTYTPSSSTTPHGGIYYPMSWDETGAAWKVEVPVGDWTTITEAGTVKTRVEILKADAVMYSVEAPGSVALGLCPKDLAILCAPDQTLVETSSSGTLLPTPLPLPTTFSSCGPVTVECTPPLGSPFPAGFTSVTCVAKDKCGETAKCDMLVRVSKALPLTITCPASLTVTASSAAGAAVTYAAPTASGGCGAPTITCAPPSGSTFPIGTTAVTCSASDMCAISATCGFNVTVKKPQASEPAPTSEPNPPPSPCPGLDYQTCTGQYGNVCQWVQDQQNPNGSCVSN